MSERWATISRSKRYEISDGGAVRNSRTTLVLKQWRDPTGYLSISLYGPKIHVRRRRNYHVHRLVLEAFSGPCPSGHQGAHIDGDRTNNVFDNLVWATPKQNSLHKRQHGTDGRGETNPQAKLSDGQVREIRYRFEEGEPKLALSKLFGVSRRLIRLIVLRKVWVHV